MPGSFVFRLTQLRSPASGQVGGGLRRAGTQVRWVGSAPLCSSLLSPSSSISSACFSLFASLLLRFSGSYLPTSPLRSSSLLATFLSRFSPPLRSVSSSPHSRLSFFSLSLQFPFLSIMFSSFFFWLLRFHFFFFFLLAFPFFFHLSNVFPPSPFTVQRSQIIVSE